jgi:protein-disulfide isomerase
MIDNTSSKGVKDRKQYVIPIIIFMGIISVGAALFFIIRPKPVVGAVSSSEFILTTPYPKPLVQGNTMGDPNAPVVIEEFSDFQCAYCRQFFLQTERALIEKYVIPGKVYFIYRTLGDWLGPGSQMSAEAAYCAGDQEMFWEYHAALFTNQGRVEFSGVNLLDLADTLGLDMNVFDSCVESYKYRNQVIKDLQDGLTAGVRGTPSFLINDKLVAGVQPYSYFQQAIETALNEIDQE